MNETCLLTFFFFFLFFTFIHYPVSGLSYLKDEQITFDIFVLPFSIVFSPFSLFPAFLAFASLLFMATLFSQSCLIIHSYPVFICKCISKRQKAEQKRDEVVGVEDKRSCLVSFFINSQKMNEAKKYTNSTLKTKKYNLNLFN